MFTWVGIPVNKNSHKLQFHEIERPSRVLNRVARQPRGGALPVALDANWRQR
jgi:hypothetical protein